MANGLNNSGIDANSPYASGLWNHVPVLLSRTSVLHSVRSICSYVSICVNAGLWD